jgi:hypothetical protein
MEEHNNFPLRCLEQISLFSDKEKKLLKISLSNVDYKKQLLERANKVQEEDIRQHLIKVILFFCNEGCELIENLNENTVNAESIQNLRESFNRLRDTDNTDVQAICRNIGDLFKKNNEETWMQIRVLFQQYRKNTDWQPLAERFNVAKDIFRKVKYPTRKKFASEEITSINFTEMKDIFSEGCKEKNSKSFFRCISQRYRLKQIIKEYIDKNEQDLDLMIRFMHRNDFRESNIHNIERYQKRKGDPFPLDDSSQSYKRLKKSKSEML